MSVKAIQFGTQIPSATASTQIKRKPRFYCLKKTLGESSCTIRVNDVIVNNFQTHRRIFVDVLKTVNIIRFLMYDTDQSVLSDRFVQALLQIHAHGRL